MTTVTPLDARRRPTFGLRHRLVLSREIADMEQTDIAAALGVTRQTVSNYERGVTEPRRAILLAWAMATAVDADWLVSGQAENPRPDDPDGGSTLPGLDSNQEPAGFQSGDITDDYTEWPAAA